MDFSFQSSAISVLFSLIFLCNAWLRWRMNSGKGSKFSEAPEPAGALPIIGHLHLLGGADKLLHQILGSMADMYGSAFNIRMGSQHVFVISGSEIAREFFTTNDRAVASRPTTAATKHMCYDHAVFAFEPYSPHWREMRKIVMVELLSNRRLETIKHIQASEIDLGMKKLYDLCTGNSFHPVPVELNKWFDDLTFNVIVKIVAGKCYASSPHDHEAELCKNAIQQFFHLMGIFVVSDAFPSLRWLDLEGHEKAMKKTAKDMDYVISGWLEEHRQRRASGMVKEEGERDFIDVMLSLEAKGDLSGFPFDEDTNIKSTCLALIVGAGDTTSTTLTWAVSLLLNNPSTLKKAQEEIDLHVGKERRVEESDMKNLVYVQAIIKETLRLYPVAPLIPRVSVEDCTIAGFKVPAKTRLLVNVWKIQRDPRIWENPLDFKPERFLTSSVGVDLRGQHYELIPFGSGRRSCPGAPLAIHGAHLTLARLLHAFDLANSKKEAVNMRVRPGTTTPKATPLEIILSPRLAPPVYF